MSIPVVDGLTILASISQDDRVNGDKNETHYRQSQYRYHHNDGVNNRHSTLLRPDIAPFDSRLARIGEGMAGKRCVE